MDVLKYFFFSLCILGAGSITTNAHGYKNCFHPKVIDVPCGHLGLHSVPQNLNSRAKSMYLGYNLIKTIHNTTFRRYTDLETLSLKHNNINTIEDGSFEYLQKLKYLILSFNNFKVFDQSLPKLEVLDLHSGPLKCFDIRDSVVRNLDISDTDMDTFPDIRPTLELRYLNIVNTRIKPVSLEDIAPLCNLDVLEFDGNFYKDCDCEHFLSWIKMVVYPNKKKCIEMDCTKEELKLSNKVLKLRNKCTPRERTDKKCSG